MKDMDLQADYPETARNAAIIPRKQSKGFGKSNLKTLFEAIEREEALKGGL